jgi:hypothetical protein
MMFVLQFYQWYVEKLTFYQAVENSGKITRYWKWSSDMKRFLIKFRCLFFNKFIFCRYDHHYDLIAEFSQGNKFGQMKVTRSITSYITEDGEVLVPVLKKEVDALKKSLLKGQH